MLSKEFLVEYRIHSVSPSKDLHIEVQHHYRDQFYNHPDRKGMSHFTVGLMLEKLPTVIDQLREIPVGDEVWVYKPSSEVSLGFKRFLDKKDGQMNFSLNTVMPNAPHKDGLNPIIIL